MTDGGLHILPMEETHITAVAELGRECFSLPWSEEGYRSGLKTPRSLYLAALEGGRLAGFLCASSVLDEAEIELVASAPGSRRRGIASRLLERFLTLCAERGISLVHLEVRASNEGAARLYERHGFVRDGLRKGYYRRPPEDALLYSLRLPPAMPGDTSAP